MTPKENAFQIISNLVERFEEQKASYKKTDYNETLVRRDFIDPFFKALGWDVDNAQGYAEAYREVIHEDRVKVGSATKAPDYSFRLPGGKRLFFVEAKKPSVVVKTEILPAYQVRRYAWSAKLPISILTDFEEFAVYDCNKKPAPTDKASTGRIQYFTYNEYLTAFDFLYDTFARERVPKGSLDKFIASDTARRGTTTVDKEFLLSLDGWRMQLAQNLALRNPLFTEDELNFAVQQTLDRIIFLRIAEDRGIEDYGHLKKLLQGDAYYTNLFHYFNEADAKYNSGLFDFKRDKLSAAVQVDNKVLKTIINELYYPESPYEFSVLSVEILGSAYEQFLGKQIKLSDKHKAVVEEKPEVRKAGGVYYTPQYIVDYIVQQTVGKLVEGKKPEQVAKLRIVDPACGSGSFLIGAYQYLLNWHRDFYGPEWDRLSAIAASTDYNTTDRNKAIRDRSKLPLTPDRLITTSLKKQILLNNIYGVDIDTQAVEVSKLSLLLKCMEGETSSSITAELRFGERVLPTLERNIRSGNSLIDLDFYDGEFDFEPGAEKKIKPFSWQQTFPEVFKQGGFDAVIGNPPYVRQEMLGEQKIYFAKKYKVYHGMADLYTYFFERGLQLLKPEGLFGIIVANKWMRAAYGEPLRKWLKGQTVIEISDFGDLPVFQGATTYPCIVIAAPHQTFSKAHVLKSTAINTLAFDSLASYIQQHQKQVALESLQDEGWNLGSEAEHGLLKKLQSAGIPLGKYVHGKIYRGVLTGLNEAFVIDEATKNALIQEDARSAEIIKPFLAGRDIKRYQSPKSDKYLIFTKRGINIDNYPAIKNHLLKFKEYLTPKPKGWQGENRRGRKPGTYQWYEIQDAVDYYAEFEKPKILWPGISLEVAAFALDENKFYGNDNIQLIISDDKFLLGILNSKVSKFQLMNICDKVQGGFYRLKIIYIKQLSIKIPENKIEHQLHDEIVTLVDTMLALNKEKQQTTLPEKRESLQHRIQYTNAKINGLVYRLYGLTEEEIALIEAT